MFVVALFAHVDAVAAKPSDGDLVGYLTTETAVHAYNEQTGRFTVTCKIFAPLVIYSTQKQTSMASYNAARARDYYPIYSPCDKTRGHTGYIPRTFMAQNRPANYFGKKKSQPSAKPKGSGDATFDAEVERVFERLARQPETLARKQWRLNDPARHYAQMRAKAIRIVQGRVRQRQVRDEELARITEKKRLSNEQQALEEERRKQQEEIERQRVAEDERQAEIAKETALNEAYSREKIQEQKDQAKRLRAEYLASLQSGADSTDTEHESEENEYSNRTTTAARARRKTQKRTIGKTTKRG